MNLGRLVAFAVRQKIVAPLRRLLWGAKRRPFLFKSARGLSFILSPPESVDGSIYIYGIYEQRLLNLLENKIHGGVMLDVGANIGNHALYLAKNFEKIICLEPNPVVGQRLKTNILINNITNIRVIEIGLGDENADLPFRSNTSGNLGGGSFRDIGFPVSHILPVRIADEILSEFSPVTLVKIDVEGFEDRVLRGMRRIIARDRPVVVFEYDGRQQNHKAWSMISESLPGYVFYQLIGVPGTGFIKVLRAFRDGIETKFKKVHLPESRFYESILAFPSPQSATTFGVVID